MVNAVHVNFLFCLGFEVFYFLLFFRKLNSAFQCVSKFSVDCDNETAVSVQEEVSYLHSMLGTTSCNIETGQMTNTSGQSSSMTGRRRKRQGRIERYHICLL